MKRYSQLTCTTSIWPDPGLQSQQSYETSSEDRDALTVEKFQKEAEEEVEQNRVSEEGTNANPVPVTSVKDSPGQ